MKYSLFITLILCSSVSLATSDSDPLGKEVYWVEVSNPAPEKSVSEESPTDKPENIIRLDKEFPMLFALAAVRGKSEQHDASLQNHSPLTSANNAVSPTHDAIGSLTQVRPKTANDYDPLIYPVKWRWDGNMTVGKAVKIIAKHTGYRLIVRDETVVEVYSLPLPYIHRNIKNVDARTALELLGGPGLMVVIDPASRTVMHRVREKYVVRENDNTDLPRCVEDLTFAESPVGSESGVLIVGGKKCTF